MWDEKIVGAQSCQEKRGGRGAGRREREKTESKHVRGEQRRRRRRRRKQIHPYISPNIGHLKSH